MREFCSEIIQRCPPPSIGEVVQRSSGADIEIVDKEGKGSIIMLEWCSILTVEAQGLILPSNFQQNPLVITEIIAFSEGINPFHGGSKLLVIIATVSMLGKEMERVGLSSFSHIVRANHRTDGFFEKLVNIGAYQYCDIHGDPIPVKRGIPQNETKTCADSDSRSSILALYKRSFPNPVLENIEGLMPFAVDEAVEKMMIVYRQKVERYQYTLDSSIPFSI